MARKIVQVSSKYKAHDGTEKWRNATVGVAFVYDNGDISIALDPGISVHSSPEVKISLREPFQKDGKAPTKPASADNIPF